MRPTDHTARQRQLFAAAAAETGAGALLVTNPANVRWLTGFDGSNAAVLLLPERTVLATDARYESQARGLPDAVSSSGSGERLGQLHIIIDRGTTSALLTCAADSGELTLGFEACEVSVAQLRAFEEVVGSATPLVPVGPIGQRLRTRKDAAELRLLRHAAAIATMALEAAVSEIQVGMSEVHIARLLEARLGDFGANDRAFPTIVATGPNSAIPHHLPTAKPIQAGELLKIDFGAEYRGYNSDCTRMFIVAAEPEPWQLQLYDLVDDAAASARLAAAPGVTTAAVDAAARSLIAEAGLAENFGHGCGHGVGLEIHEAPMLGPTSEGILEAGQVITIEPGVYLPGRGGVRIEDMCAVDDDGIEVLTQSPRELRRLG